MPEDFNRLRLLARQLVRTPFQKDWLFRLELEGEPAGFDLYVKDVSYSPIEVMTDDEPCGATTMTWPTGRTPARLTATVRDDEDGRIASFVDAWCERAAPGSGVVGLPYGVNGYVKKVRVYNLKDDGSERLAGEWEMFATGRGESARSRENGTFMEFQISLVQFSTATRLWSLPVQKEEGQENSQQDGEER